MYSVSLILELRVQLLSGPDLIQVIKKLGSRITQEFAADVTVVSALLDVFRLAG